MRVEITTELGARVGTLLWTTCGGTAALGILSEWTMALLGVPLIVVLAAIAGIALVVSYQEHAHGARLVVTVVASIVVACAASVFAIEYGGWPKGGGALMAAAVGAGLQIFVPWAIVRGPAILDQVLDVFYQRITGRKGGSK